MGNSSIAKGLTVALCASLLLIGCRTISEQAERGLDKPVSCATAEQDIALLEEEKASVGKQLLSGIRMVLPAAAVMGILRRDMRDRAKVAAGVYNDEIDAKIAEIRESCGLQTRG